MMPANRKKRAFFRRRTHVKTIAYDDSDRARNRHRRDLQSRAATAQRVGNTNLVRQLMSALAMIKRPFRVQARG